MSTPLTKYLDSKQAPDQAPDQAQPPRARLERFDDARALLARVRKREHERQAQERRFRRLRELCEPLSL